MNRFHQEILNFRDHLSAGWVFHPEERPESIEEWISIITQCYQEAMCNRTGNIQDLEFSVCKAAAFSMLFFEWVLVNKPKIEYDKTLFELYMKAQMFGLKDDVFMMREDLVQKEGIKQEGED